jgi:hypothetical protein
VILVQQLAITHTRFPAVPRLLKKPQERPEARETAPRFPVSDLKHARKRQSGPPLRAGAREASGENPCPDERWRGRWNFRRTGRWSPGAAPSRV